MSPQPFTHEIAAVLERAKRLLTIDAVALGKGLRVSESSFPMDPKNDKALHRAIDLLRGLEKNSAFPARDGSN